LVAHTNGVAGEEHGGSRGDIGYIDGPKTVGVDARGQEGGRRPVGDHGRDHGLRVAMSSGAAPGAQGIFPRGPWPSGLGPIL
jgi:hypothetical protein